MIYLGNPIGPACHTVRPSRPTVSRCKGLKCFRVLAVRREVLGHPALLSASVHCLQGAATCWFSEVSLSGDTVTERGDHTSRAMAPATTLLALQRTIQQRKEDSSGATGCLPLCLWHSISWLMGACLTC